MKKIFISVTEVDIGGIDKSLICLLDAIDYSQYSVDLFVYDHDGAMMNCINTNVNLLDENPIAKASKKSIVFSVKNRKFSVALIRLWSKIYSKIRSKKTGLSFDVGMVYTNKIINEKYLKELPDFYDLAISFAGPHYFVLDNVKAKIKMGWIHTDYSNSCEAFDVDFEREMWAGLDYIVAVSENCKNAFIDIYPELSLKVIVIENLLSKSMIFKQAESEMQDHICKDGFVSLLSIGRFCDAKNFDNVPEIASIIKSKGIEFKWYLIGYGEDETLIKSRIKEYGMEDNVIILGKKSNPYPYIKACDVYVQPSRYEGKCVAVREAQILNKPVIITDYNTSKDQIKDKYDGLIVPLDNEGCAKVLSKYLVNKELLQTISENTKENDYTNSSELEKIYAFIK